MTENNFTDPQLGRVGMTENEAQKTGVEIKVSRYDMKSNGRAREFGETEGFIKVLVDAETDRILGAAVLATEGAELVHILDAQSVTLTWALEKSRSRWIN